MEKKYFQLKTTILELFQNIEEHVVLDAKIKRNFEMSFSFIKRYSEEKIFMISKQIFNSMKDKIMKKDSSIFQEEYYTACIRTHNFPYTKKKAGKMLMKTISTIYNSLTLPENREEIWVYFHTMLEILDLKDTSIDTK